MTAVVVSQPMYFPWVGMLEQIRLADHFVYYDDVQFSRGGFFNRVQIKTAQGVKWMTAPLRRGPLGAAIHATEIDEQKPWRTEHRAMLARAYASSPHVDEMLKLVDDVFARPVRNLAELAAASMDALCVYFEVAEPTRFDYSSRMTLSGQKNDRLLELLHMVETKRYITGHGALDYLDHERFEREGIQVEYMNYEKRPYPQQHGQFTPFVTALDLVANCGRAGREFICSGTVAWRRLKAA